MRRRRFDAVALEKIEHQVVAAGNLRLRRREIAAARHESQRPQREIRSGLAFGKPFHLDVAVGRASACESAPHESAADGNANGESDGCKKRTVGHGRSIP